MGGFLVGKSRSADQNQRLALIRRQLRQRLAEFAQLYFAKLLGLRLQRIGVMAVSILDLTPALAIFRAEVIAQDGEQPGRHVGAGLERVDIGERAQHRLLHQIIRAIHVPAERDRECTQAGHGAENGFAYRLVHGHQFLSLFPLSSRRLSSSVNRSGTPWLTTSSYMARSCWPRRA